MGKKYLQIALIFLSLISCNEQKNVKVTEDNISAESDFKHHRDILDQHISSFYKDSEIVVLHEILRSGYPLDIYIIDSKKHKFKILITSGLSSFKMNIQKPEYQFAELMMLVPKEFMFAEAYTGKHKNDWIIDALKISCRTTIDNNTFLYPGHTFQAKTELGNSYSEHTKFTGSLILRSATFDENFTKVQSGQSTINIYSLFPLYKEEYEFRLTVNFDKFLELLILKNAKEVVDINRKSLLDK